VRVLLIDDHALFRVGLQGLLERRGIGVVAAVGTGREGLRLAKELSPDIILLDMRMPGMDGLDVLQRLRENGVAIPIVMLTTSSEERDLLAALRAGAQGYLLKDMEPDELVAALAEIAAGKTVVTPHLTGVLISAIKGDIPSVARRSALSELTPREQEILRYLAEGRSNKVIAKHLGISDGTVKLHVKAILRKLGVHSRVEAAVFAVEQGLTQKA
jgi:two-component system nitrate/nitrite response regulator NarL